MSEKRLRFGTFEFDPLTRELRRNGATVRIQAQPSAVLAVLLAHAGEVVTRSALCQAVWGSETHVDFENGLNFCVAQLRGTLGDSADSPLYIKTVPKHGYQFIAAVTESGAAPEPPPGRAPLLTRRAQLLVLAACIVSGASWYAWSHTLKRPERAVRIAVARFENQSGDPGLDRFIDGLADAVVAEFTTASPGALEIIGNAAILRRTRDRQDLARVADELKADFVVLGQVQRASDKGRVLIHLIRLPDQSHLWVTRVDDPNFADPLGTQREIARRAVRDFLAARSGPSKTRT